ncbi:unnamed protein product [Aspergillus oryzae RIB40]|uniref:Small nuclear ribonucleoprotein G n=2 Tax=Aspergillus oryzae TaxID=5062 RepID=Q2URY1_ASPOR|nr:unnamed protein product [Aspergillus oryzae RIB40]EIT74108.1 hypothetical protein Ao3042_09989 [Aspergillus oryzae 3.042]KDE76849.1 hypothetical protein AO1008_02549 [Aspergillus oryzae 100-8]BAE55684.1 unnamed protein product [Aspergillus oryzae RIB40]|eukprot:EIT74108.1 hypothetical protein Ao3042_09989 [Aspergillus oryzae 3.042]
MEKRVFCQLNGNRKVIGILRGYDVFMNIVLDEAFEEKQGGEKVAIGMVVIRGNSVVMLEYGVYGSVALFGMIEGHFDFISSMFTIKLQFQYLRDQIQGFPCLMIAMQDIIHNMAREYRIKWA